MNPANMDIFLQVAVRYNATLPSFLIDETHFKISDNERGKEKKIVKIKTTSVRDKLNSFTNSECD